VANAPFSTSSATGVGRCRFRPGEEEAARRFLAEPPKVADLRISKEELRPSYGCLIAGYMLGISVLGTIGGVLAVFVAGAAWASFWDVMTFIAVIAVVAIIAARVLGKGPGPLVVSAARRNIVLGDGSIAVFEELGVPRRVLHVRTYESDGETTVVETPAIVLSRRVGPDLVLFEDSVPSAITERMDELADHINALLAEYHERTLVQRWLDQREVELSESKAYRSEAHDG
jgi:hypothetical protein